MSNEEEWAAEYRAAWPEDNPHARSSNSEVLDEPPPELDDYHAGEYSPNVDSSPNGDSPPPGDEAAAFEYKVAHRTDLLRVQREAKRRLDEEEQPPVPLPPVRGLDALLAQPDTPARFRIADLAPTDSRVVLSAQYKAGKTIIVDNLVRSLADGDPFLGRFAVNSPADRIVLIDDELSENMLRRWLRDQFIENTGAVVDVISLRGRIGALNLLDGRCRRDWAQRLADLGCDYLLLDCLRPVLDALGLDEHHDAGKFLVQFDALLADAGIRDAMLVHHMGHAGEHARGDSRLEDWPDAIWRVKREKPDDPDSPRFFSATGRDVSVAEGRLGYDSATRRLTYVGGSRQDSKTEAAYLAVIRLLAGSEPLGVRAIQDNLTPDNPRDAVRVAIKHGVGQGVLTVDTGKNNAHLHRITYPCAECGLPVSAKADRHLSCPPGPEPLPDD
jgi:AAA domain